MEAVYRGMMVEDASGMVGTVEDVRVGTTGPQEVLVRRNDGTTDTLTPGMFTVVGDRLRLTGSTNFDPSRTQVLNTAQLGTSLGEAQVDRGEDMVIPVIREEAVVQTRQVERGGVRVHKLVNEREEVIEQPILDEHVDVERIAIGRVVEAAPEVREEGDTLIIPVLEEMLVVEKRLVLKEEIRVTKRRTTDIEQARVVLREEQVEIERIDERERGNV
jgi:uncharacterized protein (TIGR02271 family)